MLLVNPSRRYSMKEVCNHQWIGMVGPDPVFDELVADCTKTEVCLLRPLELKQGEVKIVLVSDRLITKM